MTLRSLSWSLLDHFHLISSTWVSISRFRHINYTSLESSWPYWSNELILEVIQIHSTSFNFFRLWMSSFVFDYNMECISIKICIRYVDRKKWNFRVDLGWSRVWPQSTRMVETSPTMYNLCFYDVGNILVHVWYSQATMGRF
jgi:hypothetical protein